MCKVAISFSVLAVVELIDLGEFGVSTSASANGGSVVDEDTSVSQSIMRFFSAIRVVEDFGRVNSSGPD